MKIKLLIMLMSVLLLNTAANAAIISFTNGGVSVVNYAITGGSGDTWSGAFDAVALTTAANDAGNIVSISGNASSFNPDASGSSGTSIIEWSGLGNYFSIDASTLLYDTIWTNDVVWSDAINSVGVLFSHDAGLAAGQYYISGATYSHVADGLTLTNYTATPEPGTIMLLGSGVLAFGLKRFRRRKQEVCA